MGKLCTNRSQSERLEKMGFNGSDVFCTDDGGMATFPILAADDDAPCCFKAWSLTALLTLLPDVIWTENKFGKWFYHYNILKEQVEYGRHNDSGSWSIMISSPQGELVDAVFFMLCWLYENGLEEDGHLKL